MKDFFTKTNTKIIYFIVPAILSFTGAALEGVGIAFLFPLLKGIFYKDFGFVKNLPVIKNLADGIASPLFSSASAIFITLVATVFLTLVLSALLRYLASVAAAYQLRKFSDRLRRLIFNRYLTFGKLFFDRNNIGHLHNILIGFTNHIAGEFKNLHNALNLFFSVIVYVCIMFFVEYRLTLLVLLLLPLLSYGFRWVIQKIKKTSHFYTLSSKKINENIYNILSCIPLVKLYTKEEDEKNKFADMSNNLFQLEFSLDKKYNLLYPIQEIILLISILFLVSAISFIILKEKSSQISNFLIFIYLLRKVSTSFNFLNITKSSIATISGPVSEIIKILDNNGKFFVTGGTRELKDLSKNIEFHKLSFNYSEGKNVLKKLTFSVEKGKTTAIVGPSGAGKTTLISLLLRFYDCAPGSIFVDGSDIREFSLQSLRKHMALVSQDAMLFNDSLRNNITYGMDKNISENELTNAVIKARLYDHIMRLPHKFDTYIGDKGVKLSGGEKQRVTIARALLKNCEILILDEATSSLDSKTEKLIQEAIAEAIKGRTTIVIAHRLSTIKNADKIVVIEGGEFIEEGTLNELLEKKGKFYEYWQEQKFY